MPKRGQVHRIVKQEIITGTSSRSRDVSLKFSGQVKEADLMRSKKLPQYLLRKKYGRFVDAKLVLIGKYQGNELDVGLAKFGGQTTECAG